MSEGKMIKPFTINMDKEESEKKEQKKLIKPITIENAPKTKLYLLLKYYNSGAENEEDYRDFEFFTGTTQEMYDHLKLEIENSDDIDVMRSRILVDSPNIRISHKCSIYIFMKDAKDTGRVTDDTSFDIQDYYYDDMNSEVESNGEE